MVTVTVPAQKYKARQYPTLPGGDPRFLNGEFQRIATSFGDVTDSLTSASTAVSSLSTTIAINGPWVIAGGTGNALTGTFPSSILPLVDGQLVYLRVPGANTNAVPTLQINADVPHSITKKGGAVLVAGDISGVLGEHVFRYNLAGTRWEILNPGVNVFTASGPTHTTGLVPDPGSTAGILRFLREDATWATLSLGFTIYRASGGNNDEVGINALFATNKTIWLVDPAYKISAAVNIPSNGRLIGMGRGATVITGMALAATINISATTSEMCTLEDFGLTGTMTNAITIGSSSNTNDEILIRCVDIEGPGIVNSVSLAGLPYYCRIYDCKFNQVTGKHITGTGTSTAAFLDLINVNFGSNAHTVNAINVTNIGLNLLNCSVLGTLGDGIVAISTTSPSQPFSMMYSGVDSCTGHGLNLTNFGSVMFTASWLSANGLSGGSLTNCKSVTIGTTRIHFNGTHGLAASGMVDFEIIGNHVVNNNITNAVTTNGITLAGCAKGTIGYNRSGNGATVGPSVGHQLFGVALDSTCTDITIAHNNLNGNTIGPVSVTTGSIDIRVSDNGTPYALTSTVTTLLPASACRGSTVMVLDGKSSTVLLSPSGTAVAFLGVASGGGASGVFIYSEGSNWFYTG